MTFISSTTVDTTSKRFGEMISCRAVYIFDIGLRILVKPSNTHLLYSSVLAAKNLGDIAYNNFLDHTFLGDRTTTIRTYLATTGSGIMEEEPPESLKSRYGG
ncbi:hypothetical protein Golob_020764 [Gossypium lobatum]|uniref:Uncharacterized protein n=1 Tax=Gossypium lobatum TaxID=34289 RepID=A0A7J8LBF2_9ROSI|nr:hypothetical protein [Gossypium lobatum]